MKLLLLTGTFRVGSQIPCMSRIRVASRGQSLLNLITAAAWTESIRHLWFDIAPNPCPASVYLSAPLRCKRSTAFSLSPVRPPGPYVLVCSVHWSVHQPIHLPQSLLPLISPAGRCPALLHSSLSLRSNPSPPQSVFQDFVKAREDSDIGWLMLLSSLAFLSLVRTHLHAEPWFFAIAWMGISIRIYNRLLREMKTSRQIAEKNMSFHVFIENNLSSD